MRKLILIFFSLCLFATLEGQIIRAHGNARAQVSAAPSAEMLTNGELTSGTSWGRSGGVTLASNTAIFDNVSNGYFYQLAGDMAVATQANTAYTLTFDLSGTSGNGIYFKLSNTDGSVVYVYYVSYTNGTNKTISFTTPADIGEGGFEIYCYADAEQSGGTLDNLSLKAD